MLLWFVSELVPTAACHLVQNHRRWHSAACCPQQLKLIGIRLHFHDRSRLCCRVGGLPIPQFDRYCACKGTSDYDSCHQQWTSPLFLAAFTSSCTEELQLFASLTRAGTADCVLQTLLHASLVCSRTLIPITQDHKCPASNLENEMTGLQAWIF